MGYIRVLFKSWIYYILLFYLCDCNVTYIFWCWLLSFVLGVPVLVVVCICVLLTGVHSYNVLNIWLHIIRLYISMFVPFMCKLFLLILYIL
jgi:hypothetical protein